MNQIINSRNIAIKSSHSDRRIAIPRPAVLTRRELRRIVAEMLG